MRVTTGAAGTARPASCLAVPNSPLRLPHRAQAAKEAAERGEEYDPRGGGSAWSHSFLQKKPCALGCWHWLGRCACTAWLAGLGGWLGGWSALLPTACAVSTLRAAIPLPCRAPADLPQHGGGVGEGDGALIWLAGWLAGSGMLPHAIPAHHRLTATMAAAQPACPALACQPQREAQPAVPALPHPAATAPPAPALLALALPLLQEHYDAEKKRADSKAEFDAEQAYLKTLSLLRSAEVVGCSLMLTCGGCGSSGALWRRTGGCAGGAGGQQLSTGAADQLPSLRPPFCFVLLPACLQPRGAGKVSAAPVGVLALHEAPWV